jgi:hypothetical protein
MINISKNRKFPTYSETRKFINAKMQNETDEYFIYKLTKNKIGDYLNVWFVGSNLFCKKDIKKFNIEKNDLMRDELWTVKKVDKQTSANLYNEKYNPISLNIYLLILNNKKCYFLCAKIHSVDDSSFTAFFRYKTIDELFILRNILIQYLDIKTPLNGIKFIEKCQELGCDDVDYD